MVLESTLEVNQNASNKLSGELDNLHQYSLRNCFIVSGISIKDGESIADLKQSTEKNVVKDVWVSNEFFDSEFDKIHRIGAADCDQQNIIVRFRSQQLSSEVCYGRKKIKNKNIGLKPFLKKNRTILLCSITEKIENDEIIAIPSNSIFLTSAAITK